MVIDTGPVVLVNIITLDKSVEAAFLSVWQSEAGVMKQQAGCISTQLHRAIGGSPVYMNYAVWEPLPQSRR